MDNFINNSISRMLWLIEKYYYVLISTLLLIFCFTLFYKISLPNIQDWDEARHGVNAYEMLRYHNYIANYYNGSPDYWNLKPPVSYWFIMIGYKLFGYNTLGLRLFSGLSMLFTSISLLIFVKNKFGKLASLITLASFISCVPIILNHCGRTGDPDALYLLFFTLSMICLLKINQHIEYLYLSGLFFSLAFLTKSWHSFAILIIIGFFILFTLKIKKILVYQYYIFVLFSFLPIMIWALLRYQFDGMTFFKDMVQYDLLSRSSNAIEGHTGDKWYYSNFIIQQYTYWFLLLCGSFIGILSIIKKESFKKHRDIIIGLTLWIVIPFIIFSISKTKLIWYVYPIFPALFICIGAFTSKLIRMKKNALAIILILLTAFSFYSNEKYIMQFLKYEGSSDIQTVFQKIDRNHQYKRANIYLSDDISWSQSTYLSALLYGNLDTKDTGITGFVYDKHKNSLLLLTNNDENRKLISDFNFKTIFRDNQYYLIKREQQR